jgi:hypothetical protein
MEDRRNIKRQRVLKAAAASKSVVAARSTAQCEIYRNLVQRSTCKARRNSG